MSFNLFLITVLCHCSLSEEFVISDPNVVHQWIDNLELKPVALPDIPTNNIVAMKTRETHQFVYYALDNGQIAIGNANYFGYLRYCEYIQCTY